MPTSTAIPYTSTPEPFLPQDLPLIEPGNISELQKVAGIPIKEIYTLTFSQSGDKLATLSERWQDRSKFMEVWDFINGVQLLFLDNLNNPWRAFFSTDETQLYVFYPYQGIEIHDLVDRKLIRKIETNADRIDFSLDGKYLATGQYLGTPEESTIKVINWPKEVEQLDTKTPGLVMELQFSPDGNLLVGGFQRGNHFLNYVWDASKGDLIAELMDYPSGLIFSPDSSMAATAKGDRVYVFSTSNWALLYSFGFTGSYRDVIPKSFSPDGKILAAEDRNNVIFLKPDTGEELLVLPDECDVRFSPNGRMLITWCYQDEIKIWGIKQ